MLGGLDLLITVNLNSRLFDVHLVIILSFHWVDKPVGKEVILELLSLETSFSLLFAADLRWLQVGDRKFVKSLSLSFLDFFSLSEPLRNLDLNQWAHDRILLVLLIFEPSFGNIGVITDLLVFNLGEFVHFLRSANTTTEREDASFSWVGIRRRMGDTQGAIDTIAVLERRSQGSVVLFMARMAEVVRAKAAI